MRSEYMEDYASLEVNLQVLKRGKRQLKISAEKRGKIPFKNGVTS